MIRAAALLAALAALPPLPASAQTAPGGWGLSTQPETQECTASLTSASGAALAIRAPAVAESGPQTPPFRLVLWLPAALREQLPVPDGAAALVFRPAGQPAVQLTGTLAPDAAFWRFTHVFESPREAAGFIDATRAGRLTLFHPDAGVLAGFDTSGTDRAIAALLACPPAPEAAQ